MNKIDEAWKALKELPPEEQERLADAILDYAWQTSDVQLTDEQVAEVRRRLEDKNAETIPLEELRARLIRLGI